MKRDPPGGLSQERVDREVKAIHDRLDGLGERAMLGKKGSEGMAHPPDAFEQEPIFQWETIREIGPHTLLRFYILHCIFIPLIASLFMAVHFWRIRRDGFSGPAL